MSSGAIAAAAAGCSCSTTYSRVQHNGTPQYSFKKSGAELNATQLQKHSISPKNYRTTEIYEQLDTMLRNM